MTRFGKWLGAGLGWTVGGPIGAILGFTVGTLIDATQVSMQPGESRTTSGDFMVSFLVIVAAIMKADEKIMKSELDFLRNYLTKSFGSKITNEMLLMLRDLLKQNIPVIEVSQQIRTHMDYPSRLQLMHLVYGIALSDGFISPAELKELDNIAGYLGIKATDNTSLKGMYVRSADWAYEILGIDHNAGYEEIKKAYRAMAMKHHPDKVAYLGEDVKLQAKEKFQKIKEAYETLLREKGLNN